MAGLARTRPKPEQPTAEQLREVLTTNIKDVLAVIARENMLAFLQPMHSRDE